MNLVEILNALSNDRRLKILEWLRDPEAHFPPQKDGDLVKDGVCAAFIAAKLDVSAPTLSEHMRILVDCRLVRAKKVKGWTMYKRNEKQISTIKKALVEQI